MGITIETSVNDHIFDISNMQAMPSPPAVRLSVDDALSSLTPNTVSTSEFWEALKDSDWGEDKMEDDTPSLVNEDGTVFQPWPSPTASHNINIPVSTIVNLPNFEEARPVLNCSLTDGVVAELMDEDVASISEDDSIWQQDERYPINQDYQHEAVPDNEQQKHSQFGYTAGFYVLPSNVFIDIVHPDIDHQSPSFDIRVPSLNWESKWDIDEMMTGIYDILNFFQCHVTFTVQGLTYNGETILPVLQHFATKGELEVVEPWQAQWVAMGNSTEIVLEAY